MGRISLTRLSRLLVLSCLAGLFVASPARAAEQPRRSAQAASKQVTRASWYGKPFHGRRTAGGTVFNSQRLTAAHRSLQFGSKVKVTDLRSGRSVVVQITDRGPYFPGRGIDLSYAAARELGIVQRGVARVRVEPLPHEAPAPTPPVVTASRGETTPWMPRALVE